MHSRMICDTTDVIRMVSKLFRMVRYVVIVDPDEYVIGT